ncbi:MAG: DNA translocase FtsK [Oscillospiraceae bacterium]|jgi:S-DNA-T family DNA segregation ATPase FtsK/SpoIIIE|nr:DNA translocase FtsK [Oscillospiraceae bacterium]
MEDKKLAEARQREERNQRLAAGLREITYHPVKALILFLYMLTLIWAWMNKGKVLTLLSGGYPLLYHGLSLALLLVALLFLAGIIITLGTPRRAAKIQAALVEAGFVNSSRLPPLLISVHKAEKGYIYEFDLNNIPLSRWERDKEKIGAALRCQVVNVKLSPDGRRVLLQAVPLRSALPEKIYWKDEYLSPEDFTLVLGMNLLGELETVDLATTPHMLIGGGTGSGKSILANSLLMQGVKKGATAILADFKGGVDFAPVWHKRCRMVFDPQSLLVALEELTAELEHRRELFVAAGTPNLTEYNKATGENLPRYIFACDEVAEILDTTGLDKAEKEIYSQIVRHLSLIARQGRAFGIHLMLSTQRPSADLIPGQIRTNLTLRICGRADDILSRIILDSPTAAEQIPLDAKGRFVTNMGQTFQGFLFDDSILNE